VNKLPANTNDVDEVEPAFIAKLCFIVLATHLIFDPETYRPWAVIVVVGLWRLSASGSKEIGWRALGAVLLLAGSFILEAAR
jgi:hypothetical protein